MNQKLGVKNRVQLERNIFMQTKRKKVHFTKLVLYEYFGSTYICDRFFKCEQALQGSRKTISNILFSEAYHSKN